MPVYLVQAPDGRKLKVTAPEGATEQDAIAYAQQNMPPLEDRGNMSRVADVSAGIIQRGIGGTAAAVGTKLAEPPTTKVLGSFEKMGVDTSVLGIPEAQINQEKIETQRRVTDSQLVKFGMDLASRGTELVKQGVEGTTGLRRFGIETAGSAIPSALALGSAALTGGAGLGAAAGLGFAGVTAGGNRYTDLIEKGYTPEQAFDAAMVSGTSEVALETIPMGIIFNRIKGPLRKAIYNKFLAEGFEEASVEAIEKAYDAGVLKEDVTFEEALKGMGKAFAGGVVGGAPIVGTQMYLEGKQKKAEKKAKDDEARVDREIDKREARKIAAEKAALTPAPDNETPAEKELRLRQAGRPEDAPVQTEDVPPIGLETPEARRERDRRLAIDAIPDPTERAKLQLELDRTVIDRERLEFDRQAAAAVAEENRKTAEKEATAAAAAAKAPILPNEQATADASYAEMQAKAKATREAKKAAKGGKKLPKAEVVAQPVAPVAPPVEAPKTPVAPEDKGPPSEDDWLDANSVDDGDISPYRDLEFRHDEGVKVEKPFTIAQVESIGKSIMGKRANKLEVKGFTDFYNNPTIPDRVKNKAKRLGLQDVTAFRDGATIYLNANHIGSTKDALTQIHHEETHIGMQIMKQKPELNDIYTEIANAFPERVARLKERHPEEYAEGSPEAIVAMGSEIAAQIGQTNPKNSYIRKLIVMVKDALRKLGFNNRLTKMSDKDVIEKWIIPAREWLKSGKAGNKTFGDVKDRDLGAKVAAETLLEAKGVKSDKLGPMVEEQERRHRLAKMKEDEGSQDTDIEFQGNRELYKIREDIKRELEQDFHLTKARRANLEKHLVEIDDEIFQNNMRHLKKMVKEGDKKSLKDFGTDFQHNFRGYDKMDNNTLKRLYLNELKRGIDAAGKPEYEGIVEQTAKISEELSKRGIDTSRLPKFPDVDDLGEVLGPDTTLEEADAERFAQEVQETKSQPPVEAGPAGDPNDQINAPNVFGRLRLSPKDKVEGTQEASNEEAGPADDREIGPDRDDDRTEFQHGLEEQATAPNPIMRAYDAAANWTRSAADILKQAGGARAKLGQAIQDMVDNAQRNRGEIQEQLIPVTKALDTLPVDQRRQAIEDLGEWMKLQNSGDKEAASDFLSNASSDAKNLIEATQAALRVVGNRMEALNLMATINNRQVPFKMRKDFVPRILSDKYKRVLYNLKSIDKNDPDYKETMNLIIDSGIKDRGADITTEEQAEAYLKNVKDNEDYESGFSGDMGMSEKLLLPIEMYDNSMEAIRKYTDKAAERLAQIESFEPRDADGKRTDLFELAKEETDEGSLQRQYINSLKDIIYEHSRPRTRFERGMQTASTLATGLQISGLKSVLTNAIGGFTNTLSQADLSSSIAAMKDFLDSDSKLAAVEIAENLGIVTDDAFRLQADNEALGVSKSVSWNKLNRSISDMTKMLMGLEKLGPYSLGPLKHLSFNSSERNVRILSTLAAKYQLDTWLNEYKNNPESSRSAVFEQFAKEEGIDLGAIQEEVGWNDIKNSPQTARFMRRMVNRLQGSYRLDQVPRYLDTSFGRFLFKYMKYGFQLGRMFDKQVVGYIRNPETREEGIKNAFKYFSIYGGMGVATAMIQNALFGDDKLPDEEEFKKVLADKSKDDKWWNEYTYVLKQLASSMNVLGAFGPLSLVHQKANQYLDYGDDILSPPGLAVPMNTAKFAGKWFWGEKQNTKEMWEFAGQDIGKFLINNVSPLKQGTQLIGARLDKGIFHKRMVQARIRQAVKRYIDATGEVEATSSGFDALQGVLTGAGLKEKLTYERINTALLKNDIDGAKKAYNQRLKELKTRGEEQSFKTNVKLSVMARRPFAVRGKPGGTQATAMFKKWAKTHLNPENYAEMEAVDKEYMQAAVDAGLIDRKKLSEAAEIKALKKGEKEALPALHEFK